MGQYVPFVPGEIGSLNSFYLQFRPGNVPYESAHPAGLYREFWSHWWDLKEIDFQEGIARLSGRQLQLYCERKSDKRLQQTAAEFFAEIDRTILEVGLTIDAVARKVNIFLSDLFYVDREMPPAQKKELDEFLAPIYIALRAKGYNRADLLG